MADLDEQGTLASIVEVVDREPGHDEVEGLAQAQRVVEVELDYLDPRVTELAGRSRSSGLCTRLSTLRGSERGSSEDWGLDVHVGRITREHGAVEFGVERPFAERSTEALVGCGARAEGSRTRSLCHRPRNHCPARRREPAAVVR